MVILVLAGCAGYDAPTSGSNYACPAPGPIIIGISHSIASYLVLHSFFIIYSPSAPIAQSLQCLLTIPIGKVGLLCTFLDGLEDCLTRYAIPTTVI